MRRRRNDRRRDRRRDRLRDGAEDRGAVTVLAVTLLAALLLLAAAFGVVEAMVAAHRRAQSAADLAALAGAEALQQAGNPCAAAASIAAANDASLQGCHVDEEEVLVTVHVDGPRWLGQRGALAAQARAGPTVAGGLGTP